MSTKLDAIFRPSSIAVIGATRKKGKIGNAVLKSMVDGDFNGPIFAVNPREPVILTKKCFKSVLEIPDPVELAVIIVPKQYVLKVVEECGEKGVKGIIVISAGFKEVGGAGIELENELLKLVRRFGMRMVGPNCMGAINNEPDVRMNASFASAVPNPGRIAFISQSGALGESILNYMKNIHLGLSMFVSVGNKADVAGNDLLEYWRYDPNTDIILMYLESFGNPRRFTSLARDITKKKPICVVKAGRTSAGARAASSHTGAMAGLDVATDALLEQCGVIRAISVEELFDITKIFATGKIPENNRVAIVTNAGGPGIMAADACETVGLHMATFSENTIKELRKILPAEASFQNPLDLIASGGPEAYSKALKLILKEPDVDVVIAIFVPPMMIEAIEVASAIYEATLESNKCVVVCLMGSTDAINKIRAKVKDKLPIYLFPESAARSIDAALKYRQWQKRPTGEITTFDVDKSKAAIIFEKAQTEGRTRLNTAEALEIARIYGIPVAESRLVKNQESLLKAAQTLGYPVVLKAVSEKIVHKTDIGGVVLDIRDEDHLVQAYSNLQRNLRKLDPDLQKSEIIIQQSATGGKEIILGMSHDPTFGPLLMFGSGGIYVELIKDFCIRIHPITDIDAEEMIRSIKGYRILEGFRGDEGVDLDMIKESLLRLSQLVSDFHIIEELDFNPFIVFKDRTRCKLVDARIRIAKPE